MADGAPAWSGARNTSQRPFGPAFAETLCPWKLTVTDSPGLAFPQTRAGTPRWNIMWSESSLGKVTAASNEDEPSRDSSTVT